MKFNISINQKAAHDLKLDVDIIDLAIFDMLKDFSGSTACKKMQDMGATYFSVPYKKVIEEMPLLPIKTNDGVYRRFKKLEAAGIIQPHHDNAKLAMVWFCWGRNYDSMIFDGPMAKANSETDRDTPGLLSEGSVKTPGLLSEVPPDEKPTHYNTYSFSSSSNSQADFENDWRIKETFISVRRIPETKYATYLDAFCKEIAATGETHNNRAQLVKHFLNWSEIRYRIETTPARAASPAGGPQSKFIPDAQEPRGAAYKPFPKYDY